jgi:hypothetical protein
VHLVVGFNAPRLTFLKMRTGVLLTALAAVLLGACAVEGKVLGVDIGSENIKVAIVQPGRVPISIVTNEMSRRKSPGAVAFHQVRGSASGVARLQPTPPLDPASPARQSWCEIVCGGGAQRRPAWRERRRPW